jgi:methyltransferase-like protein/SAM-dependent methyltransferase
MQTDYDEVPYPALSYAQTHPDRLATIATLLGLQLTPVTRCRVLELGCAGGGNLFPMAQALPGSEFTGIDISQAQISVGQAVVQSLGLHNVSLHALDIMDIPAELGAFDYILAHGVYSWVPPQVRDRVLQVCHDHLAPQGVAYVSYNCYPGWHMMGIIRDAMLYRTRGVTSAAERANTARGMLDFMADAIPADNTAFGAFLKSYMRFLQGELKGVSARGNAFLLHDELEQVNDPVYFAQFAQHAAGHGLQFLAEADFSDVFPKGFSTATLQTLQSISHDIVEMEQYQDFLRSRMFRQTLLCHAELDVQRTLSVNRLSRLWMASRSHPVSEMPNLHDTTAEQFRAPDGATLTTDHPVSKAAFLYLTGIYPRAASFGELLAVARDAVNAPEEKLADDATDLQVNLLKAYTYSAQLVELHTYMPALLLQVSDRPVASPVARHEARESTIVTNAWHERAHLTPLRQHLLGLLDGTHDSATLTAALSQLSPNGEAGTLQDHLQWLARAALLIA